MANCITGSRLLCSLALLLVPVFSPIFWLLYFVCALSDGLDGLVARKTGTCTKLGSQLDTLADAVFLAVCLYKMLPVLAVPGWLLVWIGALAALKAVTAALGFVRRKTLAVAHTPLNKLTGFALFVLPLTLSFVDLRYSGCAVCALATVAAVQEGYLIVIKNA